MLILLAVALQIAAFDLVVYYGCGPEWMISKVMRAAGARLPLLPLWVLLFFLGLWLHLFCEEVP